MGSEVNYSTINYRDQIDFDYFFAPAFDRYDRKRDGRFFYNDLHPLIDDMCDMIIERYGTGQTLDQIRQAWFDMEFDNKDYITRYEFSTRAKHEVERILNPQNYGTIFDFQFGDGPGY